MAARADPYRQMRFLLEIDGLEIGGFTDCVLPTASSSVIEYREGNELPTPRKLPGLNGYGPLILKTGVTDRSIELFEWRALVETGEIEAARRSIAVVLLDATGQSAARWIFREAWPAQYDAPRLSAMGNEVAIERLVIAHEGFGRDDLESSVESNDDEEVGAPLGLPKGALPRATWKGTGVEETLRPEKRRRVESDEESEET